MEEVRRLRQEKGWNQNELAFHADLAPSVISLLETGKREPNATTLRKLAEALEVRIPDLFEEGGSGKASRRSSPEPSLPFDLSATAAPKVRMWLEERGATLFLMPDAEFRELVLSNTKTGDPVDGIERLAEELDAEDRAVDRALMDEWGGQGGKLLPAAPPGPDEAELRFVRTSEMTKLRRALADEYHRRRHGLWNYSKRLHAAGRSSDFLAHPKEARRLLEEAFAEVGAA